MYFSIFSKKSKFFDWAKLMAVFPNRALFIDWLILGEYNHLFISKYLYCNPILEMIAPSPPTLTVMVNKDRVNINWKKL